MVHLGVVDLGKLAYETYIAQIQAISATPIEVIPWNDLSSAYRGAWARVAGTVMAAVR